MRRRIVTLVARPQAGVVALVVVVVNVHRHHRRHRFPLRIAIVIVILSSHTNAIYVDFVARCASP
jgi:hypothetical protein